MKNPLYADLYKRFKEADKRANIASTELSFKVEGYEKRVRAYQENVDYMRRLIKELEAENMELRGRLGLAPDDEIVAGEG